MVFHRSKHKTMNASIILDNIPIKQTQFTKFLGVIIDDKLKWTRHISYIQNKISKGMGIMLKARKFLNRKILLQLYHSFVYPYLIYCLEIWGNAADIHIDPIIKLQKKIVRIITFSKYGSSTQPLFLNLHIL